MLNQRLGIWGLVRRDKQMSQKRLSVEQIINPLREAEGLLAQGKTVGEICRRIRVSEQSHYSWCREYGGLKVDQTRRQKAQPITLVRTTSYVGKGLGVLGQRSLNCTPLSWRLCYRCARDESEEWLRSKIRQAAPSSTLEWGIVFSF